MNIVSKELTMHNPAVFSYTIYGLLFSLIKEKDLGWIYSNFIQVMYNDDWQMSIFENHINLLNDCPFFQTYCINFNGGECEFISTIIDAIDNDYYIYLFLDWFYINPSYKDGHFAHTAIISGYNKKNEKFTVYDNLDNGKFVKIEVPFNIVAKSFFSAYTSSVGNKYDNDGSSMFSYLSDITLIKYNNFVFTTIDYKNVLFQLQSYIGSQKTIIGTYSKKSTFGVEIYQSITTKLKNEEKNLIRDFHFLYEHKLLMYKRIQYLNSFLECERSLISNFQKLCNEFLILRNKYIKNIMLKSENYNLYRFNDRQIEEKIDYLANAEIEYIKQYIHQIQSTVNFEVDLE